MAGEHVHVSGETDAEARAVLERTLAGRCGLSFGAPPPAVTTWLVDGRPGDLEALHGLRGLIVPWAGVGERTLAQARARGVPVYNLHHNAQATAELAVGLLLAAARAVPQADRALREGRWFGRGEGAPPSVQLGGKRAVVVGLGAVGERVGAALRGLGMEVVGVRRRASQGAVGADGLAGALEGAHALVVCCPLTPETRGLVGAAEIAALRPPRLIVNVARGPVIDEEALYLALLDGTVTAAGIDAWYVYPGPDGGPVHPSAWPFHELETVVMSPHGGGHVDEAETLRFAALATLLTALLGGHPPRPVDPELGY